MSDYIPSGPSKKRKRFSNTSKPSISDIQSEIIPVDVHFDIQSEIIKWLPAKSLLRFRSVSRDWKTHIDTNHKPHLLVSYESDNVRRYALIVNYNNFPQQIIPLTAPESLSSLRKPLTLASDAGLICFYGYVVDSKRAVIWNPTVGRSVGIDVNPTAGYERTIVGFGVSHGDPMLVKISVIENFDGIPTMWDVDVFSLTTRHWRNVHRDMQPFRSCKLECAKVCVNGVIYFRAYDLRRPRSNFFISFNLDTGVFGEVPFPGNLVQTSNYIQAAKVNESLGILEYRLNDEGGMHVCDVWTKEEGANETFNMIYTVVVQGHSLYGDVLEFTNDGEVVVELRDDDNNEQSRIVVYEPFTRHIRGVGIYGRGRTFSARSFMETEHLLDQPEPDIIIH